MKEKRFSVPEYVTGEAIKKVRKQMQLTQREFAVFVNVSKPTVERWERSEDPITGPICLLLEVFEKHPEYAKEIMLPKRKTPLRLLYMHKQKLCTVIDVNEMTQEVYIKNYTNHLMFRAFGVEEHPDYQMYKAFLDSRCFPESRDKLKLVLKDLDLPFYDPFMIIEKTQGRMAEDDFWIQIER